MKLSLDYSTAKYSIDAYDSGMVSVNKQCYQDSIVVTPDRLLESWQPTQIAQLETAHIEFLVSLEPEIILLGTGQSLSFPEPSLMAVALHQGIGFEVMDTGSACRTFNVLAAEGRNIAAALMISS